MILKVVFNLAVCLLCLEAARVVQKIPEYIKPCSRSAPDFKQCCVKNGNEALPFLLKGDRRFDVPNLLPLIFPQVDVDAGKDLKITLHNIAVHGLESIKLVDMGLDFNARKFDLKLHADLVKLIGDYEVDGKILILPIQGKGPINITVSDSIFIYRSSYKLEKRKGIEVAILDPKDSLEFTLGHTYFKLENLFNGNKAMGDNVNNFLNENWEEVTKELSGAIEGTITAIARKLGGSVLGHFAFNELFLP